MTFKSVRRIRQILQVFFFGLFIFLFIQAAYLREFWLPSDLFYRLDPLVATTAMLAGRAVIAGLLYSVLTVAFTLIFGRVWCGWVCPMGSILEWFSQKRGSQRVPEKLRTVKFLVFFSLVLAAVLGNQSGLILDPITILTRTMTTALWPGLRYLVYGLESFLYQFKFLWPALDGFHQTILIPLFQGIESVFAAAMPVFLFFAFLMGLNRLAERFWCRYLCPLAGYLGLLSRLSIFRRNVSEECINCGQCGEVCPTGTINIQDGYASDPAECTMCFDCAAVCPVDAIRFPAGVANWKPAPRQEYDPGRRQTLLAAAGVLGGIALAGLEPATRRQPDRLIRPPGARQTRFTDSCMRCGECVRVCPTQGLQPSLFEGGWQNLFTPRLMPRIGYCSYNCDACVRTCPTGAIPRISKGEKQSARIGLASINTDRCLPWAYETICSVCEEMCPLPEKAITLQEAQVPGLDGGFRTIFRPSVLIDLCIGCGVCEYHCPVGGEAAIQVQSLPDTDYISGI